MHFFDALHFVIAKHTFQSLQTGRLLVIESAYLDVEICNLHHK